MAPEAVRVWMLGGFRVSVGTRKIGGTEWRLRKAASLVKLLALSPGHRLHREVVMDRLWPELGRHAAANNLRQALHSSRRVFEPGLTAPSRYISSRDEEIVLCPDGRLRVDVDAFEEAAKTARRGREPAAYRAAIELYSGELLPDDRYEDWAEQRRHELKETYLNLLNDLATLYEKRGEYERAIGVLRWALGEEPHRQAAHAGLMRLYALSGRKSEALRQYERLEEALRREFGAEPDAETRRIGEGILSGTFTPDRPEERRHEGVSDVGSHNLPVARDGFVGREREVVEVGRTLAMTGLLTLTGAGGAGKTRLALETARSLLGAYPDGVWLVDLAPLSDGELVPGAVASALGVRERPGQPLAETLADALRKRELLLILDNCEHLVDATAGLADALLSSCPRLKILATSREPLRITGETNWRVPPLSVPDVGYSKPTEDLERYAAVRLFVERARQRLPTFSLTRETAPPVAETCRRLEGIPLAIELATARMTALAVEQVAQRLEDSLSLLATGPRSAAPRHRTMRATLEWSHELLDEAGKGLLRRLSVFAGGWTLEAVEAVGSGGPIERKDVLDLLNGLVDKSLVVAEPSPGAEDASRYRMLESVRQFARERLEESEEAARVCRRHAEHYLALAEEAEPELRGARQAAWLERLEREHDNLRAALSWALESGEG